jgi:hypothetical protein
MKTKLMLAAIFLVALVMSSCSGNHSISKDDKAECYYVFNWETNDSIESFVRVYFDSSFVYYVNGNRGEYKCIMPESQDYWLEREINGLIDTLFTYSCRTYTKEIGDSLNLIPKSDYEIDSVSYPDCSIDEIVNTFGIDMPGKYQLIVYGTKYLHNGRIIGYPAEMYYLNVKDFVYNEYIINPCRDASLSPENPVNLSSPLIPANSGNTSIMLHPF